MRARLALSAALAALAFAPVAGAEQAPGWRVQLRQLTVLRWAPRYVLTSDETIPGASDVYWRRVDQLPVYDRLSLDATWQSDGPWAVDVHTAAWAALDLTFDEQGGLVAGDFAVAYGRATLGPVALWAGRRFVPWGLPGGLHLDGGGVEARTRFGLFAEAVVGRPVTPRLETLIGSQTDFEGPATLAYGARVGYGHAGLASASLAYAERWADGVVADRAVAADAYYRPVRQVDLAGSLVLDVVDLVVEQASVRALWQVADFVEVDLGYAHADPSRLIPRWSILSAFASGAYHEVALGATFEVGSEWSFRGEGGYRHYQVPGQNDEESAWWGYRADLLVRWRPRSRRYGLRFLATRRADDAAGLTLVLVGGSMEVAPMVTLALEGTAAFDDDRTRSRDSYLGRASAEVDVGHDLAVGGTFEAASTPIAEAEVRGLLSLGWHPRWGGGGR